MDLEERDRMKWLKRYIDWSFEEEIIEVELPKKRVPKPEPHTRYHDLYGETAHIPGPTKPTEMVESTDQMLKLIQV